MSKTIDLAATLATLKATAAAQVAQYPQYAGRFESYKLARIKQDIRTKMGLAFVRGEYVIAAPTPSVMHRGAIELRAGVTAWSRRNSVDTRISTSDLEFVS